ncbi:group II intron maturase-specific domain-containing protein [Streptomyces sp. NPDC001508]|uniref:group II intron maturase-specific domain-containing protein n=1 Tax=Streptomyces sp. NPDC001508 TaxID=3154656 RepID=UPI0033272968
MTSWSCRRPANGPSRPSSWRRDCWEGSGCDCPSKSPASPASPEVGRASSSSASTTGKWSRGNGGAGSTCTGDPRNGRCRYCGTRPARLPRALGPSGRRAAVVAELNPVLPGWTGYFRKGNSARSTSRWTGTSMNGWRSAPAGNGLAGRNWAARYNCGWISRLGAFRLTGKWQGELIGFRSGGATPRRTDGMPIAVRGTQAAAPMSTIDGNTAHEWARKR